MNILVNFVIKVILGIIEALVVYLSTIMLIDLFEKMTDYIYTKITSSKTIE